MKITENMMKNKTMKIVIVIPNLFKGGAEKVLVHFVNNLDYKHYQPIIFCLKKEGELLTSINPEIQVVDLNSPRVYFSIFSIRKQLKKYKPDLLIGWMGHVNAILAFFKPLLRGRIALMCRESSIPSQFITYYRAPAVFRFMYRFLNRYDGIICQSEAMKADLVENFKVNPAKINVIHNPVVINTDPAVLSQDDEAFMSGAEKILLFVGRFSREKRVEAAVEVMTQLPPGYKLIMVGYGQLEQKLRDDIASNKLESRIRLVTNCSAPAAFYNKADCLLLMSFFEGFPNVILEANSCGCPAVVFQTSGGAKEIITETNGIYIGPDAGSTVHDFAKAIIEVCTNTDKYKKEKISEQARKQFGIEKIIKQYTAYIDTITDRENSKKK
jgi:glycosyltransferase involved in cell wall biosynthesis